jgi:hypothetical protein
VVGASFSRHAQGGGIWPDGAGMPAPSHKHPTNQADTRASHGRRVHAWPTSLAPPLAPGGLSACHGVHRPRFQGQGRPPGQATGTQAMAQASLVDAGPTPSPEGDQSQTGRDPHGKDPDGKDPDGNYETGRGPGGRVAAAGPGDHEPAAGRDRTARTARTSLGRDHDRFGPPGA